MFTDDWATPDVIVRQSGYGHWLITINTSEAADFLEENGFIHRNFPLGFSKEISAPLARLITMGYLEPSPELTVFAPIFDRQHF